VKGISHTKACQLGILRATNQPEQLDAKSTVETGKASVIMPRLSQGFDFPSVGVAFSAS